MYTCIFNSRSRVIFIFIPNTRYIKSLVMLFRYIL